ncbi:MAG: hypothetical protein LC659_06450, partial [Myxococcales bacterium]|nr:hypothetical protein [Myxococcales bacterium]
MRSSRVIAGVCVAALAGCSSPALVVSIDNPQGLPIAREHVRVDAWDEAGGATRSATHDFAVNGNLGSFAVELLHSQKGRLRVSVDLEDATGNPVGRATGTLTLSGARRTDLRLRATKRLSAPHATLLAGVPGGPGDRDGATGADPMLPARLDQPLAFTTVGQVGVGGSIALILESCGAIRRLSARAGTHNVLDTLIPCSRHTASTATGLLSDLSLDSPTTVVVDPYGPNLYIADGARILAVRYPSLDAAASTLTYRDFTLAAGTSPMHIADLALGPYHDREPAGSAPYDTLYVADDVANVVWAYPLAGGAPHVAVGQMGPCLATLPDAEKAHPPVGTATWTPGPYIAPTQAHLCRPTRVDSGASGGNNSEPVLFVADSGHGNMRMIVPSALGGAPGVTTIFDGYPSLQAFGYRFLGNNVVLA